MGWLDQDDDPDGKKGEGALGGLSDRGVEVVLDENPDANVGMVRWVISFDRLGKGGVGVTKARQKLTSQTGDQTYSWSSVKSWYSSYEDRFY